MKLSRKAIGEGLDQVPISVILGKEVDRQLTGKQRAFALDVAKGATKASAYRKAYKANATPSTMAGAPYALASNPRVAAEIKAYEVAIEAGKHRTPAALRDLVIHSLVQVIISEDSNPAQKVAAAKVLGTVTEVAAFTERKEIHTITSSADARSRIMEQLRGMMDATVSDVVERDADALILELAGKSEPAMPHRTPTEPNEPSSDPDHQHTIPLKQFSKELPPIESTTQG